MSDVALRDSSTKPEERIATVCKAVHERFHPGTFQPDTADYRDAIAPFVEREILIARIEEARQCAAISLNDRMSKLNRELQSVEMRIAKEQRMFF